MPTTMDTSMPAERICDITLLQSTTPRPNGLRLSICLPAEASTLRLENFYDLANVYKLLRACAPVQQFCKVSPKSAATDQSNLEALSAYMRRRDLVSSAMT